MLCCTILLVDVPLDRFKKTASWTSSLEIGSCTYLVAHHWSCVCLQLRDQDVAVQCVLVLT